MLPIFYTLLDRLSDKVGGPRMLGTCDSRSGWPKRGVYFFFENGELRTNSGKLRVVRVGTHAVSVGSRSTLWNRLATHRGSRSGGGSHRASIFRQHIGAAMIARDDITDLVHWGIGSSASKEIRTTEHEHECCVSATIRQMPFLWMEVDDEPSKSSLRDFIEQNTIALLSGADGQSPADAPSPGWLGHHSKSPKIRASGLWNIEHVGSPKRPVTYDSELLSVLEDLIRAM